MLSFIEHIFTLHVQLYGCEYDIKIIKYDNAAVTAGMGSIKY